MKKITLLLLLLVTVTISAQTVNVTIVVDATSGLYPQDGTYEGMTANGTFAPGEEWWGWGIPLLDDGVAPDAVADDGIRTGSRELAANSSFEFVISATGTADGWSGWGVQTGDSSNENANYTISTTTSDLELSITLANAADANGSWAGAATTSVLSNEKFELNQTQVYPNPTQDTWRLKTQNAKVTSIKVFDALGKNVLSLEPNTNETVIDGSTLKSGLYFAQIKTAAGIKSVKLIKK